MFRYLTSMFSDPRTAIMFFLLAFPGRILAISAHEFAHAWVADRCGDHTARMLGRLTLNPMKHLDLIGTLMMLLLGFGWAKPVPVNPRNYRNYRRDEYLVSVAGIAVNLALFLLCTFLSVLCCRLMMGGGWFRGMNIPQKESVYTSMNNLILYGGASLPRELNAVLVTPWLQYPMRFLGMMTRMNLALAVFNLLPIPPLDGWRIVNNALRGRLSVRRETFRYMQAALMILCFTGLLGRGLGTVVDAIDGAVIRAFMTLV